jgi:hypothetical protein
MEEKVTFHWTVENFAQTYYAHRVLLQ